MAGKYALETVFTLVDRMTAPTVRISRALDRMGIKSKTIANGLKRDFDRASHG